MTAVESGADVALLIVLRPGWASLSRVISVLHAGLADGSDRVA